MTSSDGNIFRVTGPLWGNSPVTDGFPSQRLVTRSFDVFFDVNMDKRSNKQSIPRKFETPRCSLWRRCNVNPNVVWSKVRISHWSFNSFCVTLWTHVTLLAAALCYSIIYQVTKGDVITHPCPNINAVSDKPPLKSECGWLITCRCFWRCNYLQLS